MSFPDRKSEFGFPSWAHAHVAAAAACCQAHSVASSSWPGSALLLGWGLWPAAPPGWTSFSHRCSVIKALDYVFGFYGRSDAMTANPELCLMAVPAWTAFGQSGVKTRPFSPTLPVMDNLALFLMASEKVSWVAGKETERRWKRYRGSACSATHHHNRHQDINY